MAFRFKLNEGFVRGFRRISEEQIDRAAAHIQASAADERATAVHEGRKCLKRGRALLRFVRPLLEHDEYRNANAVLRDVGRALSTARDRDVMRATIQRLAVDKSLKPGAVKRLQGLMPEVAADASDGMSGVDRTQLVDMLTALKVTIGKLELDCDGHRLPTAGLAEALDDCRKGFASAYDSSDPDAFHDWRKVMQLHWRHMQLVVNAWPEYCTARMAEARTISQLIGDDRDLAMVASFIAERELPQGMREEVTRLIAHRQGVLRLQARARGDRLLGEGTGGLCRRLEGYWSASRKLRAAATPKVAGEGG